MAKPKAGRCVHCLAQVDAITADHLFPKSWYPETTPQDLEKWKFPACGKCNKAYGKIEESLRLHLAACLDPKAAASAGIWKRALDSLNPDKARNPIDAHKRRLARQRFVRSLRKAEPEKYKNHLLPEIRDRPMGNVALHVSGAHIKRFAEKLVRGTVYITERRYIDTDQEINVSLLQREGEGEILKLLEQFGELHERGPGIRIRKAVAHDAKTNALFVFDIWDQFRFYGYVMDRA